MRGLEIGFWASFVIVFYAFLGYGIVLYIMVRIKRIVQPINKKAEIIFEPEISLVISCFNEADVIAGKIANCKQLNYPSNKLTIIFIIDGSTDNSEMVLKAWPEIKVLHQNRWSSKTASRNRAMKFITTPFVIFSDVNTLLNTDAVKNLMKHFVDNNIGCVSGEKRLINNGAYDASVSGESIYRKYESFLTKLDSELYSAVGATGELVAFRTDLYIELPEDTLLDDFMESMQIAAAGHKILYDPEAYAVKTASSNVAEELKRRVHICAGGWQAIIRLWSKLSMRKTPWLFFQYFSHRVLRWTITPFLMIVMFVLNMRMGLDGNKFYQLMMGAQVLFYSAAIVGIILENRHLRFRPVFVPYYFCLMNYAVLLGLQIYISGQQKLNWAGAQRKVVSPN